MKTILIIDDEQDLCALLTTVLRQENYTVDIANSLAEAKRKLEKRPQIVLLDNNLPDGSGIEFLQMNPDKFIKSYVVLMSADSSHNFESQLQQERVDAVIRKPFTVRHVKDLIKEVA
jgi:DNA-binding response OmpR family regulator